MKRLFTTGCFLFTVLLLTHSARAQAPVADFTPTPNPAGCGETIEFDGSSSTIAAPHTILEYRWDFDDDGVYDDTGKSVFHQFTSFGDHPVTLQVTSDQSPPQQATETKTVEVSLGNSPPVADANGPYQIEAGSPLTLDGTGSSDPDESCGDSIVLFEWDLDTDGIVDFTGAKPTVPWSFLNSLQRPGIPNVIFLRVTDSFGEMGGDQSIILINVNEPHAVIQEGPNPVLCGSPIFFDGSNSSHGHPSHNITTYEWDFDVQTGFSIDANGVQVQHSYTTAGFYTAALRVWDDNSPPKSHTTTVQVQVDLEENPPIADAGGPYHVLAGNPLTLDASATTDPDAACGDEIIVWAWDLDGDQLPDAVGETPTVPWADLAGMSRNTPHPVLLQVEDATGLPGSATSFLTLHSLPNNPCCIAPDNGSGTIDYPADCPLQSFDDVMLLIDGLPPGTTLELDGPLTGILPLAHLPGGPLGGGIDVFDAVLEWNITGTGDYTGYQRSVLMPIACTVHTAPRTPGDLVQVFNMEMYELSGTLFGDPDFDLLRISAGVSAGLPSPGETTLTQLPDGNFAVDSFFDITYQIEFIGAPGGPFDGLGGTTIGTIRMETCRELIVHETIWPSGCCASPDNGSGTTDFPASCPYESVAENMHIIDGLPAGTTMEIHGPWHAFQVLAQSPGGSLGGEVHQFDSEFTWNLVGTGSLAGFHRQLSMPALGSEAHTGPRVPGDPVQTFDQTLFVLQGELFGDPDFDFLRITAGDGHGLPCPGATTITRLPDGDFAVDSFFDVTYRIDFVGAPGSILDGLSGSTIDQLRLLTCEMPPGPYLRLFWEALPGLTSYEVESTPTPLLTPFLPDVTGQYYENAWMTPLSGSDRIFRVKALP